MKKENSYESKYYQVKPIFDKTLSVLFGILAMFHLLFTMSIYVMGSKYQLIALKVDRYLALTAIAALVVYIVLMMTKYRLHTKNTIIPYIKQIFSGTNLWVTLLFIWYLLSCVFWGTQMGGKIFKINDRLLMDVVISFFVLYMFPWDKRAYDWFVHTLMLVNTVFMLWVLYNVFSLNVLKVPGGRIYMSKQYSLSIACNRNSTGAFAAVFLMLALCMISMKKGIVRGAYIIAALIQLFPLYLSNSRTAYLACVIAIAAAGFFLVQRVYNGKCKLILSLGCAVLCGAIVYGLKYGVFSLYNSMMPLNEHLDTDGIRDVDLLNTSGRLPIWKAAVKAMFLSSRNFMLGVTPARVEGMLGYLQNIENYMMYTHNQFLQVGVAFGIPGLIIYCVWLLKTAKQCWKVALKGRFWMVACTILMLVAANLTESYLIAYFYFCGSVFFLVCGMVKAEATELSVSVQNKPLKFEKKKKAMSGKKKK